MCGITGILNFNLEPVSKETIKKMTDLIFHRGPDEEGCFFNENYGCGVRRLSIIDIAKGSQPIKRAGGNLVIAYNGEIYNYKEIKEELSAKGRKFSTDTDTETVLAAYEEWGENCLKKLNGIFAFAIYDVRKKEIFLVRDRLGVKPLFYYKDKKKFVFGSELKSVMAHPAIKKKLNLTAVSNFLTYGYTSEFETPLENIFPLRPGYFIKVNGAGAFCSKPYWRIPSEPSDFSGNKTEASEEIYSLLKNAVKKQLVADVDVSLMLSSGLDSGALAYILHHDLKVPMEAFSMGFEDSEFDESKDAENLARMFDIPWERAFINSDMVLKDFPKIIYHSDSLQGNPAQIIYYYCNKLIHDKGYKVTLNGSGGDELFFGYQTYRADTIFKYWRFFPKFGKEFLRAISQKIPIFNGRVSIDYMIKKFFEYTGGNETEAHSYWRTIFTSKEQQILFKPEFREYINPPYKIYTQVYDEYAQADFWTKAQISDFYGWLIPLLSWVDSTSMANSVELRVPFLDHLLVEKVVTLPQKYKFKGYELKKIMKTFLKGRLPEQNLSIEKRGTHAPIEKWLKKELKPLLNEYLSENRIGEMRLFNGNFIQSLIKNHVKGIQNNSFKLWNLLTLSAWMKEFKISL